jgi:hypothetical protein
VQSNILPQNIGGIRVETRDTENAGLSLKDDLDVLGHDGAYERAVGKISHDELIWPLSVDASVPKKVVHAHDSVPLRE